MTIRQRTKALATGPGEKLRKALELGPEHSGTCAQLARAVSQYRTRYRKCAAHSSMPGSMLPRIQGLLESLGTQFTLGCTIGPDSMEYPLYIRQSDTDTILTYLPR